MKLHPELFPDAERRAEYRRQGFWGDATLLDYWNMAVRAQPEKVAVLDNSGARKTYAALDADAGKLAAWLVASGVEPGDAVSVQLPGWVEFTLIYVACLKAGAVINPVIPAYRSHELGHFIRTCKPKVLFMPWHYRKFDYAPMAATLQESLEEQFLVVHVDRGAAVEDGAQSLSTILAQPPAGSLPSVSVDADDIAAVLFTSGTEKKPKGALLTHNNIISSIRSFAARLNLNSRDIMFMPSPVGHATGFHHGVTTPFMLGGTSVLQDTFNAEEALKLIAQEKCTYGMGAAPFVHDLSCAMSRVPYNIESLRFFLCGGASSPRHLLDSLWEKGFRVINVYGSTESVPHTTSSPLECCDNLLRTDGRPVDGCEVKVVDKEGKTVPPGVEGEEWSRGPNVFVGYLGEPELTRTVLDADGWYRSGDLCVMDDKGYVRIIGRKKDIIVRGGENISSREVEELLLRHPHVAEAAVVGIPDPRLGEQVCAYLTLKGAFTFDDMKQLFTRHCVARCKQPVRLEQLEEIPKNAVGKVRKDVLRKDIAERVRLENAGEGAIPAFELLPSTTIL